MITRIPAITPITRIKCTHVILLTLLFIAPSLYIMSWHSSTQIEALSYLRGQPDTELHVNGFNFHCVHGLRHTKIMSKSWYDGFSSLNLVLIVFCAETFRRQEVQWGAIWHIYHRPDNDSTHHWIGTTLSDDISSPTILRARGGTLSGDVVDCPSIYSVPSTSSPSLSSFISQYLSCCLRCCALLGLLFGIVYAVVTMEGISKLDVLFTPQFLPWFYALISACYMP